MRMLLCALAATAALSGCVPPPKVEDEQGVDTRHDKPFPAVSYVHRGPAADGRFTMPELADFWSATPTTDGAGVDCFKGKVGSCYYNVSKVAFQALGSPSSYPDLDPRAFAGGRSALSDRQRTAFDWLDRNAVALPNGSRTWHYNFPLNYNNLRILPPWPSAFAQAAAIHAFLVAQDVTGDRRWLDEATTAALAFEVPADEGGLTSRIDGLPFFEEVPLPDNKSPHILNGHLYSVAALGLLRERSPDPRVARLHEAGLELARRLLPHYDQGYWTRYDLAPRFHDVELQLAPASGVGEQRIDEIRMLAPAGSAVAIEPGRKPARPTGSVLYGDGWGGRGDGGRVLRRADAFVQTRLPSDATPPPSASDHRVEILHTGPPPIAGVFGFRPRLFEYYALDLVRSEPEGARTRSSYRLPLADLQWSDLPVHYVDWHARLLTELHRKSGSDDLYVAALRWRRYIDAHAGRRQALHARAAAGVEEALEAGASVSAARDAVLKPQAAPIRPRISDPRPNPTLDTEIALALGRRDPSATDALTTVLSLLRHVRADARRGSAAPADSAGRAEAERALALLRRAGVEARLRQVEAINSPDQGVLVEARLDGEWALFDPRAGLAFTDAAGRLLSYARLFVGGADGVRLRTITDEERASLRALTPDEAAAHDWTVLTRGTPVRNGGRVSVGARVTPETPFYAGHEPGNAFDGDPSDDYVAARENTLPNAFTFDLRRRVRPTGLELVWNSEREYATAFTVFGLAEDGRQVPVLAVSGNTPQGDANTFPITASEFFARYRVVVSGAAGQDRLLLRSFGLFGEAAVGEAAVQR